MSSPDYDKLKFRKKQISHFDLICSVFSTLIVNLYVLIYRMSFYLILHSMNIEILIGGHFLVAGHLRGIVCPGSCSGRTI